MFRDIGQKVSKDNANVNVSCCYMYMYDTNIYVEQGIK